MMKLGDTSLRTTKIFISNRSDSRWINRECLLLVVYLNLNLILLFVKMRKQSLRHMLLVSLFPYSRFTFHIRLPPAVLLNFSMSADCDANERGKVFFICFAFSFSVSTCLWAENTNQAKKKWEMNVKSSSEWCRCALTIGPPLKKWNPAFQRINFVVKINMGNDFPRANFPFAKRNQLTSFSLIFLHSMTGEFILLTVFSQVKTKINAGFICYSNSSKAMISL